MTYGSFTTGTATYGSTGSTVSISGSVSADGSVTGILIIAVNQSNSDIYTTTTDSNGDYQFIDLPVSDYNVFAPEFQMTNKPFITVN